MKTLTVKKTYQTQTWKTTLADYSSDGKPSVYVYVHDPDVHYAFLGVRQAEAMHRWLGEWLKKYGDKPKARKSPKARR